MKTGILSLNKAGHPIIGATHPDMYSYLPTHLDGVRKTHMSGAGFLFIARTEQVWYKDLLH